MITIATPRDPTSDKIIYFPPASSISCENKRNSLLMGGNDGWVECEDKAVVMGNDLMIESAIRLVRSECIRRVTVSAL